MAATRLFSNRLRFRELFTFYIPLAVLVLLTLFPFYWMLITSFKSDPELYNVDVNPFIVLKPTLEHYIYLLRKTLFIRWSLNTLIISLAATCISLVFGICAGYALARLRFPGSATMGTSIFVTYLVPPTLLFIPLTSVVRWFNLLDSRWALILTYPTFLIPFCTWLLMGYFKTIPRSLEECAMVDGATRIGAMVRVVLPVAVPGLLSAGIFAFTLSWNEFLYALVFLSSTEIKTISVAVVNELVRSDHFYWGSLMAGALLGSVPIAIIYSFFVEYYVEGMTGAVKG
jgi:multiple sugar transport system permease protein